MKILFVITSWSFGGAEIQVRNIAKKMSLLGHEILIISLINPNPKFIETSSELSVVSLNMKRGFPDLRAIFRLKQIIKNFQPDVVHAHMIHAVIISRITRLIISFPKLISTAHSIKEGGKIREFMYRYTDFLSDVNTNVSKAGTSKYIKKGIFSEKKTIYIPNGIEIPAENYYLLNDKNNDKIKNLFGIENYKFVGISVGRLTEAKDYPNLFKAIKEVATYRKDFVILIAGVGELKTTLEKQINSLHISDYVKLIGLRNDVLTLMQESDFFIMSSAWEGLPIVILEAASVGLPAIVTDVGGNKEVIEHNFNGLVSPPKNSKLLAKNIRTFLSFSKDKKIEMSKNNIQIIKNKYLLNTIIKQWIKIYK